MTTERELTLKEWCAKLPENHRVNRELRELEAEVKHQVRINTMFSKQYNALLEKLRELISDIDKLNELLRWDRDGWDAPESIVFAASDLSKNAHAIIEQEKGNE